MTFEKKNWDLFTIQVWEHAHSLYPSLRSGDFAFFKKAISPFHVILPTSVYKNAKSIIEKIDTFAQSPEQMRHLNQIYKDSPLQSIYLNNKYPASSLLMAYDFHWSNNQLKLIEVNTNASGYLYSALLTDCWQQNSDEIFKSLIESFREQSGRDNKFKIAITDQNISTQKMFFEFLMFRDLFAKQNILAELCECKDLDKNEFDFIYNRSTDFYFEENDSQWLQKKYLRNEIRLSPHPKTYLMYADKNRLLDFTEAKLGPELLQTCTVTKDNMNDLWDQRKKLFFKPKQSFGGRGVYRGANITRNTMNKIVDQNYIAQEYAPPGLLNDWKYDLRFYVYKQKIQHVTARVYQGQVTGFQVDGSGFAAVSFKQDL
jgi:hypothetical protein